MKSNKILRGNIPRKEILRLKKDKKNKEEDVSKVQKSVSKLQKKKFKKQYKKDKKQVGDKVSEISRRKRMKFWILATFLIFGAFIIRIGWIQFVNGGTLKEKAYAQQTADRSINPKRGTIYDATGKNILAVSSTVDTITVNPVNISKNDKEKVAEALANIFELDYDTVLKKVKKRSSIEIIAKKVDKEKSDALRIWMNQNNITKGINIDEDTKRYYPYNNLASQIIGFCGSDNQGLDGIESVYEEELKGKKGKIIKVTDANRRRNVA